MIRPPCEHSRKNFRGCIKKLPYPCHCIRKFMDKTFAVQGKTAKSTNVLSLKCFVLYGNRFIRVVAELDPRFVLPSRYYLSEVVIPEIHAKTKFKVTELLRSTKYVCISA